MMPESDWDAIHEASQRTAGRLDAEDAFNFLMRKVRAFQAGLDERHELGIRLANFGTAESLHIRGIGYQNPNLVIFQGVLPDGSSVELVQHLSQLNFLMVAVAPVEEKEPYRIGFEVKK